MSPNFQTTIQLFLTLTIIHHTSSYTQQKILHHFKDLDINNDSFIDVEEYSLGLKEEDLRNGIDEQEEMGEEDYYEGLVGLLYEMYDLDKDGRIALGEWVEFAKDIVDEKEMEMEKEKEEKGVDGQTVEQEVEIGLMGTSKLLSGPQTDGQSNSQQDLQC